MMTDDLGLARVLYLLLLAMKEVEKELEMSDWFAFFFVGVYLCVGWEDRQTKLDPK